MAKLSTIEFAKKRLNHACEQHEDDYIIQYWRAYLDGAKSQRHEDEKEIEELMQGLCGHFSDVLMGILKASGLDDVDNVIGG